MANTKIPAELSSTPGIIDNSNATAITIDSSENVGIGTSPENSAGTWRNLQFGGGNLAYRNGGANDAMIGTGYLFKTDNSEVYKNAEAVSRLFFDNSSMIFQQAGSGSAGAAISWSEAMRIDSSGNLLVGTTNNAPVSNNVAGVSIRNFGEVQSSVDGAAALYLNRKTSDGDIAVFRKNGSTVGSIGVIHGNNLFIGAPSHSGLQFGTSVVYPTGGSTGDANDATVDIGASSQRFKDLYLSGGVHLGGTGSANKLDDYEEGTWSPTIASGTVGFSAALYTKVGRLVMCQFIMDTFSDRASGNAVVVGNLPFAAEATNRPVTIGCLGSFTSSSFGSVTGGYLDSTTTLRLYNTSTGAFRFLKHSDLTSTSTTYYVAFSYMAA